MQGKLCAPDFDWEQGDKLAITLVVPVAVEEDKYVVKTAES